MAEFDVTFARGFSLNEALAMLEDDVETAETVDEIIMLPPENATAEITDEDSGAEDIFTIDNLPASQLQAQAEIRFQTDDDNSSEDDVPLFELRKRLKSSVKKNKKRTLKRKYEWAQEDLPTSETVFEDFHETRDLESPMEYFSKFFDEEMMDLFVSNSNKYAQQKNRTPNIKHSEFKAFIGVILLSGYVQVPRRRMYWEREKDGHNELVAEAISRDRFEYLFSNLHVSDNHHLDQNDKFAKVRPLFDLLNKKFLENSFVEEMHSIDEAMVPYYGRHGCKQYIHGKPIRYGFKLWVGSTRLGYLNWFEPYQGAATNISERYAEFGVGAAVVLEYAQALRKKWTDKKFHLFFDNFFTSIPLIEELTKEHFYATGTARENRLAGNTLINSKILKKEKRGTYDYKKISDQNIIAVKWHDNSIVTLCSNYSGVEPLHIVKRYSQKEKKNIQVEQPHLINMYNANMGGVDRSDQNISLYRTSLRGKKWYFPLLTHCIDMCVQNAWQLHRKNGGNLDQLNFRRRIATMLLIQNKKQVTFQKGHSSKTQGIDLRYDRLDHFVIAQAKQTRCGYCHERTTTRCSKCDIGVHVKCFVSFHTK